MRTKPTMHKRMLRSALVAAFSVAVALGTLTGLAGTKDDVRADSTWRSTVAAGVPGDSTWLASAAAVPGDSTWFASAAGVPGDSTWVVRASDGTPGDSTWVVTASDRTQDDSTWSVDDSTWAVES
ncbi:putative secreted protein [Streptomyces sp. MAA16]|nr:putative secreted protein [Streptomyces sp. MAA16]